MNADAIVRMIALALHGMALANATSHVTARQTVLYDRDGNHDRLSNGGTYGGYATAYKNLLMVLADGDDTAYEVLQADTERELHDYLLPLAIEGDLEATEAAIRKVFADQL